MRISECNISRKFCLKSVENLRFIMLSSACGDVVTKRTAYFELHKPFKGDWPLIEDDDVLLRQLTTHTSTNSTPSVKYQRTRSWKNRDALFCWEFCARMDSQKASPVQIFQELDTWSFRRKWKLLVKDHNRWLIVSMGNRTHRNIETNSQSPQCMVEISPRSIKGQIRSKIKLALIVFCYTKGIVHYGNLQGSAVNRV